MIILSDCLTEVADEGCLKVASSLARRLRAADEQTLVVSYGRQPDWSDVHLKLNKLFLNLRLWRILCSRRGPVLYIPFASNTKASALRLCVLSLVCRRRLKVLFALRHPMDGLTRWLLRCSGAQIITLSGDSCEYFTRETGAAMHIKAGVDTKRFTPVSAEKKAELRAKYGVAPGKKALLHVGHLTRGRNVEALLQVSGDYHVFLAVSSVTQADNDVRRRLEARPDTTIIDAYLPNVEELYQMADVYLFPVVAQENCIDLPLSVMEAASCNLPVVTTEYGELKAFRGEAGFAFLDDLGGDVLNAALNRMSALPECENRHAVKEYDWDRAVAQLIKMT